MYEAAADRCLLHPCLGRGSAAGTVLGAGTGSAPQLSTGTALRPGRRASIPQISQSQVWNWVKIGLEGYPCPLGCSGVRWFEGERCPWLAAATLHGSWGYFGFWTNWNTKYGDFSLQPRLWGWLRVKLGWAASALLQPLEIGGPSPRSVGVVLGLGQGLKSKRQRHRVAWRCWRPGWKHTETSA